jgi:hypothetical protein
MRSPERLHPERAVKLKAAKSPRTPGGPFANLTWEQQRVAEQWLWKFCKRWEGNLPNWRRAILIGVAKRLAVNPPVKNFARALNAHHGIGVFVRRIRCEGRPHPGIAAMNRKWARQAA